MILQSPTRAAARRRGRHTIRRQLGGLLTMLGVLVGALLVVATLQLRASDVQARAESQRNKSFHLAESMRQSSNELTQMVRLYVATGQPRFRDYYNEILAIRAGTSRRPVNYDSSFWDRVRAEGEGFVDYGKPESLVSQMKAARFTPDEFDALNASLRASNGLAQVELEVMDRVARRIARGVDARYFSDVTPEYLRLVDSSYLDGKNVIMSAIDDFVGRVESRAARTVDRAHADARTLAIAQLLIVGLIALVGVTAMWRASRVLMRPLKQLASATDHFASGQYKQRVDVGGAAELEGLASAFNHMASAVESDVTRREVAEREAHEARGVAEEANRAKSTFVAAMSHEIRTPMIGVTGMLEVLAQTELTAEQENMVSTASGSANVLLQIIGDILDFSKIEAGKLELAPAAFMVRPLAESAVQTFFHTASAKGLRIGASVEDDVAAAHYGDALRVRQILSNFISNAIKFTPTGDIRLNVRVLGQDNHAQTLEFSLADTGIGIAPDRQRELFQEFVQAEATTAAQSGGTGLGLVICRRLAALMGGEVRMESAPGEGTTMYLTVRLPIAEPHDVEASKGAALGGGAVVMKRPKPSRALAEQDGSLLLLAEDHPINQRVLVHQLGLIGFHVDVADNGEKAFELFRRRTYALVLTDINMPEMDGFDLTRAIRQHEAGNSHPRTPIIAMSANVLPGEADRCATAGMDDFIAKPAPMGALAGKLRHWLPHLDWPTAAPPVVNDRPEPSPDGLIDRAVLDEAVRDDAVLDKAVLDELTDGDDDLATSILADYLDSAAADVHSLRDALASATVDDVRRDAHRIKGASATVGATKATALAARLERAASLAVVDWAELRTAVQALEAAIAEASTAVRRTQPA